MLRHTLFVLFLLPMALLAKDFQAGGPSRDREEITLHLAEREHLPNAAGNDGFGLCVFTALDMAAKWSNESALIGFRDFMTKHPGGGWPEKVDQFIPKMAASKGLPLPGWVQHTGGDVAFLRHALMNGRYLCVTYDGRDNVFYRGRIAHMVNLVHFSDRFAVIQDNNFPGQWLWMAPDDFLERWRGTGGGWAIALTKAGPPPIPVNIVGATPQQKPAAGISEGEALNFGVQFSVTATEPMYRINGQPAARAEALAALGRIPDDAGQPRLTIVGHTELRQLVLRDFDTHPALTSWKKRLLVQAYPPDHWAVADVGFAPGLTFQQAADAQGKSPVLFRLPTYPGAEALASALRQADPSYRPERDPDPTRAEPLPPVSPPPVPSEPTPHPLAAVPSWTLWGALGVGLGWFLRRLRVPSITPTPLPDVRTLILEVLYDVLRGSAPRPNVPTNEDLRHKLWQLLQGDQGRAS